MMIIIMLIVVMVMISIVFFNFFYFAVLRMISADSIISYWHHENKYTKSLKYMFTGIS